MSLDFLILLVCCTAIILLGLLIISRNPHKKINKLFLLMSLATSAWTVFNYLSVVHETNLLFTRFVFFGGILTALSIVAFISNFPVEVKIRKIAALKYFIVMSIIMTPVVFLPQFISSVSKDNIQTSVLYPAFIAYVLYALVVLVIIIKRQVNYSVNITQRQQVVLVSSGIMLYAALAVISNVLLPLFVNDWSSSRYGPVFSLVLVVVVAYSIVKHKLFDVRLIVARSVGYILTIAVISIFYGVIVFGLAGIFLDNAKVDFVHQVVYVGAAVFLSFTLLPVKKYFDKFSNKIFYRDNYDPQAFIDELNTVLVSTIDLRVLLEKASGIISSNLKAEFCTFDIGSKSAHHRRQIGASEATIHLDDIKLLEDNAIKLQTSLISRDDLSGKHKELFDVMSRDNISIIVSIAESKGATTHNYILLGPKKSGNPYNKQDQRVIGLIADELSIAIQNALRFEEIQLFNETLQQKIADATREMRRTNEKLKALDEAKDEFISMASHQLRTPLTSVKGYVSMVLEGDAGKISAQQKQLLEQAFTSSQRMVYLIADLLNVSRLKTGKFVIEPKPTQLADVVEGEVQQLKESAKAHNLELSFIKPEAFPILSLDETKTRQVVMNFMDNAIYYTPAGGHIKVELNATDKVIEYKVIDDGLGVPKAEQHHLFTKFFRAGNAKKARPDGTGLGLYMAKKVIVAQGGSLIFESQEGKGSTFGFSFPRQSLEASDTAYPVAAV